MQDVLVIGAGPAGLLAAWVARQRGAKVCVLATGIGTTHISPGWLRVLDAEGDLRSAFRDWIAAHPAHPYALAGWEALVEGIAVLREVCEPAGLRFGGDLKANYRLPSALGAVLPAALVPQSFAAGDLRQPGPLLIAGPAGWRDFYPTICAENLARQGIPAQGAYFDLTEMLAASQFDLTSVGLARLFERADVRTQIAAQLKPRLDGAGRVGLPAVLGLERHAEAWQDLQDRLGVAIFEIPTLPPSVPGMRLYLALKNELARSGVQILLDMTVARGLLEGGRATGVVVPGVVREMIYRAETIILATGGLYGGGIASNHRGEVREVVFDLPLAAPALESAQTTCGLGDWFDPKLLAEGGHRVHYAGMRANSLMQPVDEAGHVAIGNVRVAGRALAGYNPLVDGSAEGVWLATAYQAATQ